MLRKNAVYDTEITDYTADGMGVAHAEGCAVFIPNAIAGEKVRISIVHAGKNKAIGKIEDILERSPHRIARDCPWAKVCGGCDFRHMDYEEELRLKAQRALWIYSLYYTDYRCLKAETISLSKFTRQPCNL